MAALSQLVLVVVSLVALLPLGMAATTYPIGSFCWEPGMNYGELNSSEAMARRRSINFVLSDLAAKARTGGGFATSRAGRGYDAFYGLAQCRGDVSAGDCDACLAQAAKQMVSYCNYTSDSRMWYEYCFMRYDNYNFIGEVDTREDASVTMRQWPDMDNPKAFQKAAGKAMGKATAQAVAAGGGGLGRAKEQHTPFVSVSTRWRSARETWRRRRARNAYRQRCPSLTRHAAPRRGARSTTAAAGRATRSTPSTSRSPPPPPAAVPPST